MSFDEWVCNHCDGPLDDDCVRIGEGGEPSYCWGCARVIANSFLDIRKTHTVTRSATPNEQELLDRLDAVENLARRVKNVWTLWLNDAQKGAINPGTFHTMKMLLGMEDV